MTDYPEVEVELSEIDDFSRYRIRGGEWQPFTNESGEVIEGYPSDSIQTFLQCDESNLLLEGISGKDAETILERRISLLTPDTTEVARHVSTVDPEEQPIDTSGNALSVE